MIDPKKIEEVARQIQDALPKGVREFGEDIEKKIRMTLQSQLSKLDVISREEFDVQTQVLLRSREKLAQLEKKVAELEAKLSGNYSAEAEANIENPPSRAIINPVDEDEPANNTPADSPIENKE